MNARMLVAAVAVSIAMTASAKVTVSGVFGKDMVLPRDREVPVWGKADPGEKVKVAFTDKSATATADADGNWCATLPPLAASSEPQVLTITSQTSQPPLAFANVLVGDVFLYAGSTAADSRFSWEQEKKFDWAGEIGKMDSVKGVRFLMQRMAASLVPTTYSVDAGAWFTPSSKPGIWQGCPIFPWLFASAYVAKTGVPCGVVTASMPWRQNEMFISTAAMATDPAYAKQFSAYLKLLGGFAGFGAGCKVKAGASDDMPYVVESRVEPNFNLAQNHNAMIRPVLKFAFKGAIWFPEPKEGWRSADDYGRINRDVMAGMVPLGVKEFPVFAIDPKKDRVESAAELVKLFDNASAPKTVPIAATKTAANDDAAKPAEAFSVSKVFADNMVLQRGKPVPVWGKAKPETIVKVLFAGKSATAKANATGDWCATLPPLEMSAEPQVLTVVHQTSQAFSNVLVGDVWYASGQSNAEMSFNWGLVDGDADKAKAVEYPNIRHTKFDHWTSVAPVRFESANGEWTVCGPKTVGEVSAMGYFFARKVNAETGVPIGLLGCNWSGCRIEPFVPFCGMTAEDAFVKDAEKHLKSLTEAVEFGCRAAARIKAGAKGLEAFAEESPFSFTSQWCRQWNAMVEPAVRFPVKGVLWYQGCSNNGEGKLYAAKLRALIAGWREKLGDKDLPFYIVQLASYQKGTGKPEGGDGFSGIREAQREVAVSVPNCGIAVTTDIGNEADIHPKNKRDVGERLALWALRDVYRKKNLVVSGPMYKSMKVERAAIRIAFDHIGSGLWAADKDPDGAGKMPVATTDGKLKGFSIQGADGTWHFADAKIDGDTVVVSSPEVADPKNVRYAYRASVLKAANLCNREGLPASPFKTDEW